MQTSVVATLAHRLWATTIVLGALTVGPNVALADEGGVSFWIPGLFGSLAAAPLQPGWSLASIYFHESVSAGGDVAAARQAAIGRFAPTVNVNLNATIAARPDLIFVNPS